MTKNPPTTAAISIVMLSVSAARPVLACALVLDSERDKLGLKFSHIKNKNRKMDKNTNAISTKRISLCLHPTHACSR